MTAPVDVLAVMDAALEAGEGAQSAAEADSHAGLAEARAAVAELIEADVLLDRTQEAYSRAATGRMRNDLWADVVAAKARRAATLARVQGGGQ